MAAKDLSRMLLLVLTTSLFAGSEAEYIRGCYFTNWAQYRPGVGKYWPTDYVSGLCTHIFYAFAKINTANHKIEPFEWNDLSTDWSKGQYELVNDLKKSQPGLKTLISVGGWNMGTQPFQAMSANAANRKVFIDSVIKLTRENNFDGFDLDWEYPAASDKANYAALIQEMYDAFTAEAKSTGKQRLLLTAAVSAAKEKIQPGYDVAVMNRTLDMLNIMSYDFHGAWDSVTGMNSPLYRRSTDTGSMMFWNTADGCKAWNDEGMAKKKIILGLATYGRGWTLSDLTKNGVGAPAKGAAPAFEFSREAGIGAYYELCKLLEQGAIRHFDSETKVPYLVKGDQWHSYDDQESFGYKLDFVMKEGYGGAFVWTLDFDNFNGQCAVSPKSKYPLISMMQEKLGGSAPLPTSIPQTTNGATSSVTSTMTTAAGAGTTSTSQAQTQTVPPPTTTSAPGGAFQCPGDGLFPDPTNPNSYYSCSNGIAHQMSCPTGLVFDTVTSTCTWPKKIDAPSRDVHDR